MGMFYLQISHILGLDEVDTRDADARKSGTFRVGFRNQSGTVASGSGASGPGASGPGASGSGTSGGGSLACRPLRPAGVSIAGSR